MWNKFKELISWNEYNTPSTLFLYFLTTYGDSDIRRKRTINTCDLTWATIGAILTFLGLWSIAALASMILAGYLMFIALWIGLGFHNAMVVEELFTIFAAINGIVLLISAVVGWAEYKDYRATKRYEERQKIRDAIEDGTYVEPPKGMFQEWFEAFHNKFCKPIDLNKFRPQNRQVTEYDDWE